MTTKKKPKKPTPSELRMMQNPAKYGYERTITTKKKPTGWQPSILGEPLPCGHPESAVRGKTTQWCSDCVRTVFPGKKKPTKPKRRLTVMDRAWAYARTHYEETKAATWIAGYRAAKREGRGR